MNGKRLVLGHGKPDLVHTHLGWVVAGSMVLSSTNLNRTSSLFSASAAEPSYPVEMEWMKRCWELEEVAETRRVSPSELACERHFKETVSFVGGLYTVRLPFKASVSQLGESRSAALSRLYGIERKMAKDETFRAMYVNFMDEYLMLDHMEECDPTPEAEPHYYIPHFGVWKLDSTTTKLRVVFDASCPTTSGVALNDLLMVGPTV